MAAIRTIDHPGSRVISNGFRRRSWHLGPSQISLGILLLVTGCAWAQGEGTLNISVSGDAMYIQTVKVRIAGSLGLVRWVEASIHQSLALNLPAGDYCIDTLEASPCVQTRVSAGAITRVELPVSRRATHLSHQFPASNSLAELLLTHEAGVLTEPLSFGGNFQTPQIFSLDGLSWTGNRAFFGGLNLTSPLQPGRLIINPAPEFLSQVSVIHDQPTGHPTNFGAELALRPKEAGYDWHGSVSLTGSGAPYYWKNLDGRDRGQLFRTGGANYLTRGFAEASGRLGKHSDLYMGILDARSSQEIPQSDQDDNNKMKLVSGIGKISTRNVFGYLDAWIMLSRSSTSMWNRPTAPEYLPLHRTGIVLDELRDLSRNDDWNAIQTTYTRTSRNSLVISASLGGYGWRESTAPNRFFQTDQRTTLELSSGKVVGPAPFWGQLRAADVTANVDIGKSERIFGISIDLSTGGMIGRRWWNRNLETRGSRITATAYGQPAYDIEIDRGLPINSSMLARSAYFRAKPVVLGILSIEGVLGLDSEAATSRQSGILAWTSVSPRLGISIRVPRTSAWIIRASIARLRRPMASALVDMTYPSGVSVYDYERPDPPHSLAEDTLLRRAGSRWTTRDAGLSRPYADCVTVGSEFPIGFGLSAVARAFRRDERNRIISEDQGTPANAWSMVAVPDLGPDGIAKTFDDGIINVFSQDAATLGMNRYVLRNAPSLRTMNAGATLELSLRRVWAEIRASYSKVKSFAATNPGSNVWQNDPGFIGSLMEDPNASLFAFGHPFFDRANVGKLQLFIPQRGWLPSIGATNTYLDGSPFARRMLVVGLPQGPFLVNTTLRGSPEGGNRTEYLFDTSLRISREFGRSRNRVAVAIDILNLANNSRKIKESDVSGVAFNQRQATAIQPPRCLRFQIRYSF